MNHNLLTYQSADGYMTGHHSIMEGAGNIVSFALQSHKEYELYVLLSEKANFFVEGSLYPLSKGDLMIFNSNEMHNVSFNNATAYERFVMHFTLESIIPYQISNYDLLNVFNNRKLGQNNKVKASVLKKKGGDLLIADLIKHAKSPSPARDILVRTTFIQLLVLINTIISVENEEKSILTKNDKINAILLYINDNLAEDLRLDCLSERFYMSKYNMCHLFKQVTGFSVNQYITYKRVLYAEKLISGGKSTLDACIAAGFNDYSNFYKTFKKLLKKPPKSFK